jgi:hypothetical protein
MDLFINRFLQFEYYSREKGKQLKNKTESCYMNYEIIIRPGAEGWAN